MEFGLIQDKWRGNISARARLFCAAALVLGAVSWLYPITAHAQSSFYNLNDPPSADQVAIGTAPLPQGPPLVGDQVCNRLARCFEILDNHPPDSFDYALLAADFDRFGGLAAAQLIERLTGDNDAHALAVLARSTRLLSPGAQRQLARFWVNLPADSPLPTAQLVSVMSRHASPMMRSAAIDSLSGPRAQGAFMILSAIAAANVKAPLRATDPALLARALASAPHPALIDTLSQNGSAAVSPIIARGLLSGDKATTTAAYAALYDRDREDAFRALVATLYDLRADQSGVALAFSHMLRARHTERKDGFYMSFAGDLMVDPEMSAMGRMVGFDALLQTLGPQAVAERAAAAPKALLIESFNLGLQAHTADLPTSIPSGYFDIVPLVVKTPSEADIWLSLLRGAVSPDNGTNTDLDGQVLLTTLAGQFDSSLALDIVRASLRMSQDYRRVSAALLAQAAQSIPIPESAINDPISHVAQAADLALRAAERDNPRAALRTLSPKPLSVINRGANFCAATPVDFKASAKSMPYFSGGLLPSSREALRGWLTTAERIEDGWLAGYTANHKDGISEGALLAYDNQSGNARNIFANYALPKGHGVRAIVPLSASTMQRPATEFWVITSAARGLASPFPAAIYRLKKQGRVTDIRLSQTLPARPILVGHNQRGGLSLSFGRAHPSLILTPSAGLQHGCIVPISDGSGRPVLP